MKRYVSLKGTVNVAEIRTVMFQGVEHLVVPVVALREGVVFPANAAAPELVLASELAVAPQSWNGRPVLPDHPWVNGEAVSANAPGILESQAFGFIFNSRVEDDALKMDVYLDPAKAEKVGDLALNVIRRARDKEMIEVSVGALIKAEAKKGVYNGKPYEAVWRDIVSDHLAMLPEGTQGACSNEMGCGAPRAAQEKPMKTLKERLLALFRFRSAAGTEADVSDQDLRGKLFDALNAVEPAFLGVSDVFPADSLVVYAVAPEDKVVIYRRGYTLSDGKVSLADDREAVEPVTRYEPVAAAHNTAGCGCSGTSKAAQAAEGEHIMKPRVKALIACPKTPFTDADETYLEGLSDERLTALESHFSTLEVKGSTPAPTPKPQTTEELLAQHPEIAAIVTEHKALQASKKATVVTVLAAKQKVYGQAELEAMSLDQLEKMAAMLEAVTPAAPVSFAGRAVPRDNAASNTVDEAPTLLSVLQKKS